MARGGLVSWEGNGLVRIHQPRREPAGVELAGIEAVGRSDVAQLYPGLAVSI